MLDLMITCFHLVGYTGFTYRIQELIYKHSTPSMNQRLWRTVFRSLILTVFAIGFIAGEVMGQLNFTQARHETDAQTSTTITLSGNLGANYTCIGACLTNWSMTVGGGPGTISSVIGAAGSNLVTVTFTPAVGIGQVVRVSHTNDGIINNIANQQSFNNRPIACSDFSFIALIDNTPPCAPVTPTSKMVFTVIKGARNSSQWNVPAGNVKVRVDWTGGTTFLTSYESDGAGNAMANSYTIAGNAATSGWSYPSNQVVCGYTSTWQIRIGTTNCGTPNPAQFVTYASHNTDAAGEGDGSLITQPLIALTDQVCEGDFVNMRFTDVSDLNCIDAAAAPAPLPINSAQRNVRVVYGLPHVAGNTIRNVFVLGQQITDANGNLMPAYVGTGFIPTVANALGTPDAFGVVTVPAAVTGPRGPLETITTSTATLVGDVGRTFNITLQYWNVCNKYDGAGDAISNNKRQITDQVIVVLAPPAPTANNKEFCNNQVISTAGGGCPATCTNCFQMVPPGATTEIKWYNTLANANADASAIGSTYGINCRFLRPENRTGGTAAMAAAGTYSVFARYRNGTGQNCLSPPVQVSITRRNALPTPVGPIVVSNANRCRGDQVTFTLPAANPAPPDVQPFGGNTQYTWTVPAGWTVFSGQGTKSITYTVGAGAAFGGTSVDVVRDYVNPVTVFAPPSTGAPSCSSGLISASTIIDAPPTITAQPPPRSICEDVNTTFTVTATGAGLTYQWQQDPNTGTFANLANGGVFSGVTTPTLNISSVNGLNNFKYRCIVTGTCSPAATSNQGVLTVLLKPFISAQPPNRLICVNGTTTFPVTTGGQGVLSYQWQEDPNTGTFANLANGGPYSGATTPTLTVNATGTGTTLNLYRYRLIVTSSTCAPAITSSPGTLTLQGPTVTITQAPTASVCADNDLQLNGNEVFFGGSFASRAWTGTYDENFGAAPPIIALSNAQLNLLLTDGVGGSRRTALNPIFNSAGIGASKVGAYVLTLTTIDDNGCPNSATITVNVTEVDATILHGPTAPGATIPGNASACSGVDLFLDGNPSGGSSTYTTHTWTIQSQPGGAVGSLTPTNTRTSVFNFTTPGAYVLSYFVQDNGGCNFDTNLNAGNITITVNPLPTASPQTPAAICSTVALGNTAVVDLTALNTAINAGAGVSTTIAWFSNAGLTVPIPVPTAATVTNAVAVFARVTQNATGCVSSTTATYTVNPTPSAPAAPVNANACSNPGTGVALSVADPGAGFDIQWSTGGPALAAFSLVTGVNGVVSGARNVIFTPNTSATATYYAFKRNTTTLCFSLTGTAVTQTQDIIPANAIAGPDQPSLCVTSATLAATPVNNGGSGLWTIVGPPGAIVITTPTSATSTVTGLPQNPPGGAAIATTLRWTASSALGACPTTQDDVILTVNALPAVTNLTPQLCEDIAGGGQVTNFDLTTLNASVTGGTPGVTVEWFAGPGITNPILPATTPQTIANGGGFNDFFFRLSTAVPCTNTGSVLFTINPRPAAAPQTYAFCEDSPPGSLQASGIDLTAASIKTDIISGAPAAQRTITWHPTLVDAQANTNPILNANNFTISATTNVFARVVNTVTLCENQAQIILQYQARPNNNQITDGIGQVLGATYTVCASSNLVLLQINPGLNPGSTYTWTVPPVSYAGEFELLTGTTGFFIILRFVNPIPGGGTLYPTGLPISVKETLGTALCDGNTINTRIIVEGSPPKPIIAGPGSVCSGANGLVYNVTNPVAGSYAWTLPPGATITSLPVTASSITVQMSTFSGNITVTHASGTGCTSPAADPFPVTVVSRPSITSANSRTICSRDNVGVAHTLNSTIIGTTYNWDVINVTGFVTGAILGDFATGVLSINQTLTNTSGVTASVTYRVIPIGPGPDNCPGTPQNLTITINPEPVILAGQNKTICSAAPSNFKIVLTPAALPATTTFSWPVPVMSDLSAQGTARAGVAQSDAIHIFDAFVNTSAAPITATYTISPISGSGCPGVDETVTITINPEPVGAAITRAAQCSNVAFSVSADNITNGVVGSTFTWVRNALPIGLTQVTGGTGTGAIAETLRNLTGGQLSATYVVTPTSGAGCPGATYVVTVPVNPEPVGAAITRAAQCSDVAFSVSADNITNGVAGSTFTWARNSLPAGLTQVIAGTGVGPIAETLRNQTSGQLSATYVVTPTSGAGCQGATYVITVPVNPEPLGAAITRAAQCSNVAFSVSADNITNGVAGVTFTWVRNALPGGLTQVVAGTGSGAIAETLQNLTGGQLSATYVVTPTSGAGCVGATYVITVPVNPEPVGAAITRAAQCSNVAFSVSADNVTNGVVGSTFTWVRNALPGGLTQVTAGTGSGAIAETLRNLTGGQLSATYVVSPTSGAGCLGSTYVVTVPVNPEPVGAAITRAAQCSDVAFSVSADNITNAVAGVTFTWVRNPLPVGLSPVSAGTGVGPVAETLRNITGGQLSATYVVTPTSGAGCVGATYVVTVPINPEPVGAAVTRAVQCSNVGFSVSADNITNGVVGSTFTWVRNPLPPGLTQITAGTGIGAIAETLGNITGGQLSASYTVTPTSGAGCLGATYVVTVPVNAEPVGADITRAAQCSNVGFSVSADNITNGVAGVTFTWVRNALPGGLTQVTAGTGSGLIAETLRNLTAGQLSATYVVTPTSGASCVGATYVVTVPVNPEPVGAAITRPAQCSNVAYSLSPDNITNGVAGVTFTWVRNALPVGLTPVTAGSGIGPIAETLRNVTGGQLSATYVVTPTSGVGCVGATYVVTVPVNPEPVGAAITRSAQCSDVAFSVSADNITNGVVGSTFTWVRNALPAGLTQVVAGTGVGAIAETLRNLTGGQLSATYIVTPTSGAGCLGATYVVTVPVNPAPVGAAVTRAAQCSNVAFSVSADNITNGVAGVTFTWARDPLPVGLTQVTAGSGVGAIAETLRNLTGSQLSATYTVTPTSGAGCLGATYVVTVPINPEPVGADITRAAQCSNVGFSLSADNITNGVAGSTFTWVRNALPVGLTQVVAGTGVGAIAETLRNLTSGQLSADYTVTPTSGVGCVGVTYVVTVPVNPEPVGAAITRAVQCSDVAFSVSADNITNGVAGVTFTWTRNALPAGLTQVVAGTGVGPIAETLRNLTSGQLSATYTVTPTSGVGCLGATYVVTVPVNPEPVGADVTRAAQCSNVAFSLSANNITNGVAGVTFTWVRNALPVGLTQVVAGTGVGSIAETLENLTGGQLSATYVVTPTSGAGCVGATYVVTIPVNPQPIGAAITRAAQCSNAAFSVSADNITNGVVGSTFTWVRNALPVGLTQVTAGSGTGAIAETLRNLTGGQLSATYVVTPTSGAGCTGATYVVTVPVNPEPVAQALSTIQRCSGQNINFNIQDIINNVAPFAGGNSVTSKFTYTVVADFPLDVSPAVFPGTFDRVVASNALISQTFSNLSSHDVKLTFTITPISDPENCSGTPFVLEVIYHPEPVGSNFVDPVCSTALNHNIQTQITNPPPGLPSIFTYTVSSDNGGVPAGPARVVASNAPITDNYVNGTGSPANITYTITPFNAANPTCGGTPFTYIVNISPNPTGVSDTKAAVCSDVPFSIDPQGNIVPPVASTFTWTATYDFPMTGPANGTGVIAGSLHNETNGQLQAHYTVTPKAGTCTGAPFTIDLPINPEPVMEPTLAAPLPLCSTNAISTNPIGVVLRTNGGLSIAAANYIVTLKSQDAGLIGAATTGTFAANSPIPGESDAISNDTYRNTTSGQLKVVYTIVPESAAGCQGDAFDITISINPEPVLSSPGFPDVCSSNAGVSNPVNIVLGTNGTSAPATSYQLTNRQYSNGGPFGPALPPSFTANPANAVIMAAPGGINLVKNDRFTNRSTVAVTVRYTIQAFSSQGCASELLDYNVVVNPEPVLDPALSPAPVCSDVISGVTLVEQAGTAVAATFNINNIIRQAGLTAGGANASIGLGQPNNAIFNDIFTNTTAGPLTVTYKIAPVTALGCVGAEADVVFTVNPAPAVADLNKTVCTNEASGIMLATTGTSAPAANYNIVSVTIQPGLTQTAGNVGARAGVAVNEIQNDQFQNPGNVPLTVTYSVRGVTAATCIGPAKNIVLTVEPTIKAVPNNNNTDICSATPTDIELTSPTTPTSGNITFNYTAVSSIGGQITGFVPALNNLPLGYRITDNLVNNSNTTAFVTYTITPVANGAKSGGGCTGTGVPVVVNVDPKPKLVASPLVQTVCESDGVNVSPTNILLTTATVPSTGTVEFNQMGAVVTGGLTLISPLKTTYLNGETIADQWNNPTLSDQTVTYTLRPQVNGGLGCPGDDVVVTVTIKPRPIINAVANQVVCSGEYRSIPLVTDIPGTFATWTVVAPGTITGALNGGGNSIDLTLFNSGFNVETVTYTVTPKFNNCNGTPVSFNVTVNPTPNIVGIPVITPTVCDGAVLNIPLSSSVPGTTFDLSVTDVFNLEAPGFFDRTGVSGINQLVNNPTGFQAILIYQITPTSPAGCVGIPKILNVNVGSIVANVTPDKTVVCSGERIQMTNSSLGATSHRWFYRVQGTLPEIDVRTTPFVNYQLDNNSTSNPIVYEIVYQPSNGLCTVPDVVTPITVYRNVVAGFNEGTVPPIIGGSSTVNFTNTSNPNDPQFRYEWNFGSASAPATFIGATPPPVVYSQQGQHLVTLKAINIAAETAGKACENTFNKTIFVPILPLVADFTLDPPAACFPTTIKVIENKSTGDIMEWRVSNSNGAQVAVSGEKLPEFFISTPGLFIAQLTTKDSFTGQVEFATQEFEIYANPVASFQARPTTVFVPDTELTTFNFSTGASSYSWDFGDGATSDEREPKHVYKIEGVYNIVLVAGFEHDDGVICTSTSTQPVSAKQGGQTKVPNAFTPNPGGPSGGVTGGGGTGGGGSFNDVFLPIVKGVEEFNMQIFDRWGNLIFESNNSNQGWDGYNKNGNILPAGVYIYKLTLRLSDGQRTTQIGDITMIR